MPPAERQLPALLPADALKKLVAVVEIEPGDSLALRVEMQVAVPPQAQASDEPLALSLIRGCGFKSCGSMASRVRSSTLKGC